MKVPPCKDCVDRKIGCHSLCDRFKQFTDYNEKRKEAIKAEKAMDEHIEYSIKAMSRLKKKRRAD